MASLHYPTVCGFLFVILGLALLAGCGGSPAAPNLTPSPSPGGRGEKEPGFEQKNASPTGREETTGIPLPADEEGLDSGARVDPNPRRSLVGAIRWDAWVGEMATFGDATSENRVGLVVERTLGPQKWHYRLPFFAVELVEDQVQARGATQEIMDQEIAYAAGAGLDYWAFVYYPPGSGLDTSRNLYLSSAHQDEINFCLVFDSPGHFTEPEARQLFVSYFKLPNYQKVLDGRPLVYIFGSNGLSKEGVEALRADTLAAGLPAPYFSYMGWSSGEVRANLEAHGLDAGSAYAELGSGGLEFATLARHAEVHWDTYRRAGLKVVPWVTTGWDPRPRVEHPTPWVTYPAEQWAATAKPGEIAAHLQNALQWNADYPEVAEANAVIIYAWNEFDEGGWLCPTLREGTARLDAVREVLVATGEE